MKCKLLILVLLPIYSWAQQKDDPKQKIAIYLSRATNFYGMRSKKPIPSEKVVAHLEEARAIIDEGSRLDQASAQLDTLRDTVATMEEEATKLNLSLMSLHSQLSLSKQPDILIGELLKKNKSNLDLLTQCNQRARTLIQTSCSDSARHLEKEVADLEASAKEAHEKSEKVMSVLTQYIHNKDYLPKKTFLTFKEQLSLIDVEETCTIPAIDAAENLAAHYSTIRKKILELQKLSALQYTTEDVCLKIGIKPPVTSAQYDSLTKEFQELEKIIKEKIAQKSDEVIAKYLRPLDKSTPEEQIKVLSELRDILNENNLELPSSKRIDALITKLERKIAVQKEQQEAKNEVPKRKIII